MSDADYGATLAKRRLSHRLVTLRKRSGHTANHVCDILDWGRGKVGRFEANQWKRPEMSDIRDLLRIYGVEGADKEEIEDIAVRSRVRPWWRDFPEIFDNEFAGFENDATRIRAFMPLVLPALLQTTDYMDALMRAGSRPRTWREKALESKLRRQEILDRTDGTAPRLAAVITEASLMYKWGTRTDRLEQIEHLIALSRRPNIELWIQRFADGPPTGMVSMVNIFDFPGEPSIVFVETDFAIEEVADAEHANSYVDMYARASAASLEPTDTTLFLSQLAERLE
jgi:hypothetical protein